MPFAVSSASMSVAGLGVLQLEFDIDRRRFGEGRGKDSVVPDLDDIAAVPRDDRGDFGKLARGIERGHGEANEAAAPGERPVQD